MTELYAETLKLFLAFIAACLFALSAMFYGVSLRRSVKDADEFWSRQVKLVDQAYHDQRERAERWKRIALSENRRARELAARGKKVG
jgi:hypothetical protein